MCKRESCLIEINNESQFEKSYSLLKVHIYQFFNVNVKI